MLAIFFITTALICTTVNTDELPRQPESRIINGDQEDRRKYYEVAIISSEEDSKHIKLCSGCLINSQWVLTSAYCANRSPTLTVQYGTNNIDLSGNSGQFVLHKYIHPQYVPTWENDIALLKIQPPSGSTNVGILSLPLYSSRKYYLGKLGKVSGWGANSSYGEYNSILQSKIVSIIDNFYCHENGCIMSDNKLCTEGRSICEGDQGAPLVFGNDVIGVASAELNVYLCETMTRVSYTRVDYYVDWILSIINPHHIIASTNEGAADATTV